MKLINLSAFLFLIPIFTYAESEAILVQVGKGQWHTEKGVADISLTGSKIQVGIYTADRKIKLQELKGEVRGNRINVTRTVLQSDVSPEKLSGTYTRGLIGGVRQEVINLMNEYGFVGITRVERIQQDWRTHEVDPGEFAKKFR